MGLAAAAAARGRRLRHRRVKRPLPPEAFTREETYRETRLPVDLASTLIPDAYTEESFFELERERVFAQSWVPVCVTDELREPGDFLVVEVAGRSVIVCRNRGGRAARVPQRLPPPRRAPVRCGPGPRRALLQVPVPRVGLRPRRQLPRHAALHARLRGARGSARDLRHERRQGVRQGRLRAAPRALRALGLPRLRLPRRRRAAARATSSATSRSGSPGTAWTSGPLARRAEYEIHANWKLVAENFMEYYHLPWVHPSLVKVSPMDAHHRWQGTRQVRRLLHDADRREHRRRRLARPAGDRRPLGRGRRQRALRVAVPEHRAERDAEPRLPAARAPRRRGAHARDRLPAHPPGLARTRAGSATSTTLMRVLGRASTARTSRSSSASRMASRTPSTRAGACATASRSRCTASRTW